MNSFKQQCVNLRKRDYTLDEIVEITGRPKTSVYYHIKDVPLSKGKQEQIKKEAENRLAREHKKYWQQKWIPFSKFRVWNEKLVCLVAHLMFNGELFGRGCYYHNRNDALIERVKGCMQEVYPKKPKTRIRDSGVKSIFYHHKPLRGFLRKKGRDLLKNVGELQRDLQKCFVRAFFDDEGCIDYNPNTSQRRIRGYQNDMKMLKLIQELLADFSIESTIRENACNEVVVSRRENLEKFQDKINFSPRVRINHKRANSTWNQPLEKQEILARAIDSYE